jgi:hypothetical protein
MTVQLTRADPILLAVSLAFAFWMRRRPVFFAKLFSLRWLGRLLIGSEFQAGQARRNPPPWLISSFSWMGLVGIWDTVVEMAIWLVLVAKGCHVY